MSCFDDASFGCGKISATWLELVAVEQAGIRDEESNPWKITQLYETDSLSIYIL